MSKLGLFKNLFTSLVSFTLKLAPISLIIFLIIFVQKRTLKLTVDKIRHPQIQIPTIHANTSYHRTQIYIPQPNNDKSKMQWAKAYFPYLSLCHSIGLWNFIYLMVATTVLGVWSINRNIAIPGGKRVYIPKWKKKQKQNYIISNIVTTVKITCQTT